MNVKSIITGIALCAAVAALNGCGKQESSPAPDTSKASPATATETAKPVEPAPTAPTQPAAPAPAQVTNEATAQPAAPAPAQVNADQQQAQGLIDRAKSLIADQKYQDAASTLGQLSSAKLTDEQQKLVDDLKAQIQSALTKAVTPDLGGALGGKK